MPEPDMYVMIIQILMLFSIEKKSYYIVKIPVSRIFSKEKMLYTNSKTSNKYI